MTLLGSAAACALVRLRGPRPRHYELKKDKRSTRHPWCVEIDPPSSIVQSWTCYAQQHTYMPCYMRNRTAYATASGCACACDNSFYMYMDRDMGMHTSTCPCTPAQVLSSSPKRNQTRALITPGVARLLASCMRAVCGPACPLACNLLQLKTVTQRWLSLTQIVSDSARRGMATLIDQRVEATTTHQAAMLRNWQRD